MLVSSIFIVSTLLIPVCDGFFGQGDPKTYANFCRYNVDHCLEILCGKLKTFTPRPDCGNDKFLENEFTSILKKCEDVEDCFLYRPLITAKCVNDLKCPKFYFCHENQCHPTAMKCSPRNDECNARNSTCMGGICKSLQDVVAYTAAVTQTTSATLIRMLEAPKSNDLTVQQDQYSWNINVSCSGNACKSNESSESCENNSFVNDACSLIKTAANLLLDILSGLIEKATNSANGVINSLMNQSINSTIEDIFGNSSINNASLLNY